MATMAKLVAALLLASWALSACATPRRLMQDATSGAAFDEGAAKAQAARNVDRLVQRFTTEQGRLPSQAQCEDIAGAGAAQALFYPSGKAPSEEANRKLASIVSAECSKRLAPEPGAAAFYDAAAQKQTSQIITSYIEQFKRDNNRLPNLDECETFAGKQAASALLGTTPDQAKGAFLRGKVSEECLARLNASGGEGNQPEGQLEGRK